MPIDLAEVAAAITVLQRLAGTPVDPFPADGDDRAAAPADAPVPGSLSGA